MDLEFWENKVLNEYLDDDKYCEHNNDYGDILYERELERELENRNF